MILLYTIQLAFVNLDDLFILCHVENAIPSKTLEILTKFWQITASKY